jgi:hypothetical protein
MLEPEQKYIIPKGLPALSDSSSWQELIDTYYDPDPEGCYNREFINGFLNHILNKQFDQPVNFLQELQEYSHGPFDPNSDARNIRAHESPVFSSEQLFDFNLRN